MKEKNSFENLGASAIGLSGVVLFSAKSVFAKMAFEYRADPISVLYLRMLFSFPLILLIGFFYEKTQKTSAIDWKDIAKVAVISVLGYYISALFNFIGLTYIEASIERLVLFLYPTMVIFLSLLFLNKPITRNQIFAISLSYLGLIVAFADKLLVNNNAGFWFGVMLIMLSSFTYAIFLTVADGLIKRVGSFRFSTVAILTMCICMIVHAMFAGKTQITGYNSHVIWYCVLMAVLSTVIPVYLFNYSMSRLGASNVSIISCLGPVCTLLLSAILLKETITVWQIIGTIRVMGGVLIVNLEKTTEGKQYKH